MKTTPKSLRLQIALFGRTNVGKSSFLNMIAGQDVSIISQHPGTTTDVVEKVMELLPVGPVVFLDTAGVDDLSDLGRLRIEKTKKIFNRADVAVLILEPETWTEYEQEVVVRAKEKKIPLIAVINKIDHKQASPVFMEKTVNNVSSAMICSSIDKEKKDQYIHRFKELLLGVCPESLIKAPPLLGDILPKGGLAVFIVPIDMEAPKGRLILPQVQAIRDVLDNDAAVAVVKENEYAAVLARLKKLPDLAVCDSQVVDKMVADTPEEMSCTTFSILFSRYKGDLAESVKGALMIDTLKSGDKVLIAEACSHHPIEDDIGRVKIPRWLTEYTRKDLIIESCAGRDYPENLSQYKLVIHCGGCMITRREMLNRIEQARQAGVAITNYGAAISFLQGVLERVLSPFPEELSLFRKKV